MDEIALRLVRGVAKFAVWVVCVAAVLFAAHLLHQEWQRTREPAIKARDARERLEREFEAANRERPEGEGRIDVPPELPAEFTLTNREEAIASIDRKIALLQQQSAGIKDRMPWAMTLWRFRERWASQAKIELLQAQIDALTDARTTLAGLDGGWLFTAVVPWLVVAVWLVLAILLSRFVIRVVIWIVAGALRDRISPVLIDPHSTGLSEWPPVIRGSSAEVVIKPGEQLLFRPRHVAVSLPRDCRRRTKLLFSVKAPLTSIVSGLGLLTDLRPEASGAITVTMTPKSDPLAEFGVLEIPAGASMVLMPRSLVAARSAAGHAPVVRQHWRVSHLSAWLTLQLRFISFAGPCTLVVQGRRGIVIEHPAASAGPRISDQANTLGFSTTVAYSVERGDTFIAYLRGIEGLFNDSFSGGPGYVLREVVPADGAKRGPGAALEGSLDVMLKAFGV